jgi:hypothetical protein
MNLKFSNGVFRQKNNNVFLTFCCSLVFTCLPVFVSAQYTTGGQKQEVFPPLPPDYFEKLTEREQAQTKLSYPPPDTIVFGGIRWIARNSSERGEPSNSLFSGKSSEVFVDDNGKLHLKVNSRDGYWYSVDIAADTALGYGTYAIFTETKFDAFPKNVAFEFSIAPDATMDSYTPPSLAIQFTQLFENTSISPLRYLVANIEQAIIQERKERIFRPDEPFRMGGLFSTHAMTWSPRHVEFASYHDHGLPTPYLGALWDFTGSPATGVRVPEITPTSVMRLRAWSAGAPIGDQPVEIIIKKILFVPQQR